MRNLIYLAVSFLSSAVGAICGIGGGVIIKPVLDFCAMDNVSTISFLSSCTVLSMSCYSVGRSLVSGTSKVDMKVGTPLAVGAVIGGIAGKQLFNTVKAMAAAPNTVGAVQAFCLAVITVGTLVYTLCKSMIKTYYVKNVGVCTGIGVVLGIMSSFFGIGGGPINLVVLFFFFSMDTKTAAQNSLYVILFSQVASLVTTLVTRSIPPFTWSSLSLMVCGGIGGGIAGRIVNKRMDNAAVDKLFIGLMVLIIAISIYNTVRYTAG